MKRLVIEKFGTIEKFSTQAGVSYPTMRRILREGIEKSSVGTLLKICEALNFTPNDILSHSGIIASSIAVTDRDEQSLVMQYRNTDDRTKEIIKRILNEENQ